MGKTQQVIRTREFHSEKMDVGAALKRAEIKPATKLFSTSLSLTRKQICKLAVSQNIHPN